MHDAFAVRGVERVGNLRCQFKELLKRDRAVGEAMLERFAGEHLHHNEVASTGLGDFVDGADIRMIQRRRRTRLAAEALERQRVFRHLVRKKFQRDAAAKAQVLGLVDHTHAASAELLHDAVVGDGLVDHGRTNGRWGWAGKSKKACFKVAK
jgi:hypothetical protein